MPENIEIDLERETGRELVDRIDLAGCGTISSITYTSDPFRNFDLVDGVPWTVVSPMNPNHVRTARVLACREDADLLLTMQLQQSVQAGEALLKDHLQSWEALLATIRKDEYCAGLQDSRRHQFDPVKDRTQLICQAVIDLVPRRLFGRLADSGFFNYRGQLYRKEGESFAVLLRWADGEEVTEHVTHRFSSDVVVTPVDRAA